MVQIGGKKMQQFLIGLTTAARVQLIVENLLRNASGVHDEDFRLLNLKHCVLVQLGST
jgi:hypothetical protein